MSDEQNTDIFDDFLNEKKIFRNKEVLHHSYTPDRLPHRENEIRFLASILVSALRGQTPSNLLIYGITGTGKTAVTKFVGKELKKKAKSIDHKRLGYLHRKTMEQMDPECPPEVMDLIPRVGLESYYGPEVVRSVSTPIHFIYINCQFVNNQYGVLANIANHYITTWNDRIPFTGLPMEEVVNRLQTQIEKAGGITTVVLDEVDKLVFKDYSGSDALYTLTRLNNELTRGRVHLIGISNELKFMGLMDARIASSYGPEEMLFPPYDANQLSEILSARASEAFFDNVLDSGVIPYCSALAAAEHGDARRALDLLRISAELAERENENRVGEAYVEKAQAKIEIDSIKEAVKTLPLQSKSVLLAIMMLTEKGGKRITTGEVFDVYTLINKKIKRSTLTFRRITDLVSSLDILGIINARVVSLGREGRTRIIDLTVPLEETRATLLEDSDFKPLEEIQFSFQSHL